MSPPQHLAVQFEAPCPFNQGQASRQIVHFFNAVASKRETKSKCLSETNKNTVTYKLTRSNSHLPHPKFHTTTTPPAPHTFPKHANKPRERVLRCSLCFQLRYSIPHTVRHGIQGTVWNTVYDMSITHHLGRKLSQLPLKPRRHKQRELRISERLPHSEVSIDASLAACAPTLQHSSTKSALECARGNAVDTAIQSRYHGNTVASC